MERTGAFPYRGCGRPSATLAVMAITVYGVVALTFMMLMYTLERRGPVFLLGFSLGCLLSSVYGFLSGAWPFGVIEAIWGVIALRRFTRAREAGTVRR
jgi:hypothetical protein